MAIGQFWVRRFLSTHDVETDGSVTIGSHLFSDRTGTMNDHRLSSIMVSSSFHGDTTPAPRPCLDGLYGVPGIGKVVGAKASFASSVSIVLVRGELKRLSRWSPISISLI